MFDARGNFEVFFNVFMSKEENFQMCYRPPENFLPVEAKVIEAKVIEKTSERNFYLIGTDDFRGTRVEDLNTG